MDRAIVFNLRTEINEAIAKARIDAIDGDFGIVGIDGGITITVYNNGHVCLTVENDDDSGLKAYGDEARAMSTVPIMDDYGVGIEVYSDGELVMTYYLSSEPHEVFTD